MCIFAVQSIRTIQEFAMLPQVSSEPQLRVLLMICLLSQVMIAHCQTQFIDTTESTGILSFTSAVTYGSGIAAADYDNDGDIDLFITTEKNISNQLYRNDGNGNFEEVAEEVGLASISRARSALWFDFNGDHKLDLFVAGDCLKDESNCQYSPIKLYQQVTNLEFIDVTAASGLAVNLNIESNQLLGGITAGDINNDGFLDLYFNYYLGNAWLFVNNGDGTFNDISIASNIQDTYTRFWQPLMYDFDRNGFIDINLNVDLGQNQLWLNNGDNTFTNKADIVGIDDNRSDMGIAIGDYNNDSYMDLYMTTANHSPFFQNNSSSGQLSFSDIASTLGVEDAGLAWGTTFLDANNDGHLDLAATNGLEETIADQSKLWINNGDGSFVDFSQESGFDDELSATTLIGADLDRDGDLDLVQSLKNNEGQFSALRLLENQLNESAEFGNYLVIKPRMSGNNHFAIGAKVNIKVGSTIMTRPIMAGMSFYGQEPAEAFFGIGAETNIDEVIINWPGGATSTLSNVSANQILVITDNDADIVYPPTNFNITDVGTSTITLNWTHNDSNKNGFLLQRSQNSYFSSVLEFETTSDLTSYTDTSLASNTTYYYRIKTIGFNSESNFSYPIQAKTLGYVEAPTQLEINNVSQTQVILTWKDNSNNETGYVIQRSLTDQFVDYVEFFDRANAESFLDSNLEPNTTFYYRVKASNGNLDSDFSNIETVSTIITGQQVIPKNFIDFKIIPNPSSRFFEIQLKDYYNGKIMITLKNNIGENLDEWHFYKSNNAFHESIELNYPPGMYLLQLFTDNEIIAIRKIVVK